MVRMLCMGLGMAGACVSFLVGLFCIKNPSAAIRFQQNFYSKINWRLEPISMEKEIRNTRGMGVFLVLLSLASFLIFFFKGLH